MMAYIALILILVGSWHICGHLARVLMLAWWNYYFSEAGWLRRFGYSRSGDVGKSNEEFFGESRSQGEALAADAARYGWIGLSAVLGVMVSMAFVFWADRKEDRKTRSR